MPSRATFAGRLALAAATLLVLACVDFMTSERRARTTPPGPALDVVPIAGQQLTVPTGFTVNLFADGLNAPRSMALGPGGAVFVTISNTGQIVRLVDANGDGVADTTRTVLGGLSSPSGLAFRGDPMYFAEETAARRLDPGTTRPIT